MPRILTRHALVPQEGSPSQLFVIFTTPDIEKPEINYLLQTLANQFHQAAIVLIGSEWDQWSTFNPQTTLSQDDVHRFIQAHLAPVSQYIKQLQTHFQIEDEATALVGTSLTGSLFLEIVHQEQCLAGRVICFGSMLAYYPKQLSPLSLLHLFYSPQDPTLPFDRVLADLEHFKFIEADFTCDCLDDHPQALNTVSSDTMLERLLNTIPLRYIKEAELSNSQA